MYAYLPTHPLPALLAFAILAATLLLGFALQSGWWRYRRLSAWLVALLAPVGVYWVTLDQPPGFVMVVLILALLFGMKAVVAVWGKHAVRLPIVKWFAFGAGWLGMRPAPFMRFGEAPLPGAVRLIKLGILRMAFGLALFLAARLVWASLPDTIPGVPHVMLTLALILTAYSLTVHFGLLDLLTGIWRWRGVPVAKLFKAPLRAQSLEEFWGRRWNIAFAEMTAVAVYRPLRGRFGDKAANMGAFLFSGLAHELAISVPVHAGYGLPTLYFALQALGTALEKNCRHRGRLRTALWVLLPLPILFHTDFLVGVVLPLLGTTQP